MSTLVAIAYPDPSTAERVREELVQATKEHLVQLEDAVVVEHQPDGKIKLHQATSTTGAGAAGRRALGRPDRPALPRPAVRHGDRRRLRRGRRARWPTSASTTTS